MTVEPAVAPSVPAVPGFDVRPASMAASREALFWLAGTDAGPRLLVEAVAPMPPDAVGFEGELVEHAGRKFLACPLTRANATALRVHLPWLRPQPLGQRTSAGMGDRLGLATPGHIRALRAVGGSIAPVFAQQSVREIARTRRTPADVLDAATWGAFEEGWQAGYGADADHLKTPEDIDSFLAAGFTWFTVDPGALVDGRAAKKSEPELRAALARLPWERLEDSEEDLRARFAGRDFDLEGCTIRFDDLDLARAAVKYGAAIAEVARLFRHLAAAAPPGGFDFEVSVDETDVPTSPLEHFFIARELARLGVRWTSLAPRFPGSFEKGVDYRGPIEVFRRDLAAHAAVARSEGPYKISLHSGSDKFSIYPSAAEITRGAVHLKTAGTSYLEALRTIACVEPGLFREIFGFALRRYESDRESYSVSADVRAAGKFESAPDAELPSALDSDAARQVLHVTFGSVLNEGDGSGRPLFAGRFFEALGSHREEYAESLKVHFTRHLAPFAAASR
ncbi:MAG: tagaturonate epimerase family protein [Vicinamibacterales bacterium]